MKPHNDTTKDQAPKTPKTRKARTPKAKPEPKAKPAKDAADRDGEAADRLPTTVEELKASKGGLVAYLFLTGKSKEEIAKEVGSAFKLSEVHAAKIVRRISGRVRLYQRVFALMPAK
jgi:hypothetical protein